MLYQQVMAGGPAFLHGEANLTVRLCYVNFDGKSWSQYNTLRVFPGFSTSRETEKFSRNPEKFSGKFPELDCLTTRERHFFQIASFLIQLSKHFLMLF